MKIEFSKLIFIIVTILTLAVTIVSFVLMAVYGDLSPLGFLITSIFGEFATATGFYYNKAKAENRLKIKQSLNMKIKQEDINEI